MPRNRKIYNLYQWDTTEQHFIDKFNTIKYKNLLHNNIEGVYETKVPPNFRALLELGSVLKPRKNMISQRDQVLGRKYNFREL